MIKDIIKESLKLISELSPLQQFVAINPLADMTNIPFKEALKTINSFSSGELALDMQYHNKKIKNQTYLEDAIMAFIKNQNDSFNMNPSEIKESSIFLTKNITSKENSSKLIHHLIRNTKEQSILVSKQLDSLAFESAHKAIKNEILNFLAIFFSNMRSKVTSEIDNDFFSSWIKVKSANNKKWKQFIKQYNNNNEKFISQMLIDLKIPENLWRQYISSIMWELKGWFSYIKWTNNHPNNPWTFPAVEPDSVIAAWLALECFYVRHNISDFSFSANNEPVKSNDNCFYETQFNCINPSLKIKLKSLISSIDIFDYMLILQQCNEKEFQTQLIKRLTCKSLKEKDQTSYDAQLVFCIDVRSESLRRYIEECGNYQTYGFAGFFGLSIQLHDRQNQRTTNQCPALLEPSLLAHSICKTPLAYDIYTTFLSTALKTKKTLLSAFALYEMLGFWVALILLLKNYFFRFKTIQKIHEKLFSKHRNKNPQFFLDDTNLNTMTISAKNILTGMSLTKEFSKVIVLFGHRSQTVNNPYAASLDCGACGGNSGRANAILACQLLNSKKIRKKLEEHSIFIPDATIFIPAIHVTTSHEVEWYDRSFELTQEQHLVLSELKLNTKNALKQLGTKYSTQLPNMHSSEIHRSNDWAELVPEWGLVNNAAMIIGTRELTKMIDLENRVFLHSYDYSNDNGSLLESIMLGPMVVAHWINLQYYFSTVFPNTYGSGDKSIHNILPDVGVMTGNLSDLKLGLTSQSVYFEGKAIHEPLRLLVIIVAPKSYVNQILEKHSNLKNLVEGNWLSLKIIDPKNIAETEGY